MLCGEWYNNNNNSQIQSKQIKNDEIGMQFVCEIQ